MRGTPPPRSARPPGRWWSVWRRSQAASAEALSRLIAGFTAWARRDSPLTVRLAWGALAGALAVGVVVLSVVFWLGQRAGQDRALADLTPVQRELVQRLGDLDDGEALGGGGRVDTLRFEQKPAYLLTEGGGQLTDAFEIEALINPPDPRIVGLNYLCFLTTIPEQAERFQEWAGRHRIATIATESHNPKFVTVVDVSRGFSAEQLRDGEHVDFLAERIVLGRKWKQHNGHRGHDLSDMYFIKHRAD